MNYIDHRKKLLAVSEQLEDFNRKACIYFADLLRKNDQQRLICRELGQPEEDLIPVRYFEAVYWILTCGPRDSRLSLMIGTPAEIDLVVYRSLRLQGFVTEGGRWWEV